ncbi:helix-turn-helix domain-containing protein [Thalassotalea euphylliae]|uniref:helix-turn-helix domain-containing protein n=1 Tax=Thalassotalea euphylliae TaxID=1655234 RepID=UPI003634718F
MNLGEQLKLLRQEKKLSQPELAEIAGIEQSYLSKLENDKSLPSNDMLRKLLTALDIELDELMSSISSASVQKLSSLPDVEHWVAKQTSHRFNQRRNYLLISSLLIVLATTLFYAGYSKSVFTGVQHEYTSDGVVLEGEPKDIFRDWPRLIENGKKGSRELREQKAMEMTKRMDVERIRFDTWMGEYVEKSVEGGKRYYRHFKEVQVPQPINAWLQVLGVLLFTAGLLGFVLERKLFK